MSMINYPLTIDTCRQNAFKTVLAQQFDSHSRTMVITLQEDNEQFVADSSMTAVLYVTDEEHTEYPPLACSINEDGTVNVPISSLILTQRSGLYDCSLVIFNRDSERLGTFPFSLDVVAGSTVPVDTFSDESVELLTTLIGRTTGAIEDTIQATAAANSAAERAEQAAEDAEAVSAKVEQDSDGATITITDKDGTTTANIYNGQNGRDGVDGRDGADGFSPVASVSQNVDGATITITDKNGTTSASVNNGINGRDGSDGRNGTDGTSAFASVSKSGDTATITCTDVNGTTTATVKDGTDGRDGTDGADGISPTAVVSKSGDVVTISITDREGTTSATVQDASALEETINTAPVPNKDSVTWYKGYLSNGEFYPATNTQRTTDFIELKPSIPYNLEIGYTGSTSVLPRACCVYDSHWQYVRAVPSGTAYYEPLVLNASSDEKYIRVNHNYGENLAYFRVYEPAVGYQGELALNSELPIPQDDKYDIQSMNRKDGAYIHPRRPVLTINMDGTFENTETMLKIAEKYGVRCGVAIVYNEQFNNYSYSTIKGWQDKGHEILMHTSQVLDDNYDLDAGNKIIIEGAKRMKAWGFRTNGLVASSGNLSTKFLPAVKHSFEYGATTLNGAGSSVPYFLYTSSEPYTLHRYGMQLSTLAEIEAGINATISNNGFCWLYGHARNDGTEGTFTPENFETIIKYAIDKNIDIKVPYEAIKDYYSLRVMNVNFTATLDTQTMTPVFSCDRTYEDIESAINSGDLIKFTLDGSQVGMDNNYTTMNYNYNSTDGQINVNILVQNVNHNLMINNVNDIIYTNYIFVTQ